jgi:transposase
VGAARSPRPLHHGRRRRVGPAEGARVNERGTGDEQYPPRLLLGLLIYSYATGVFASRQIERATHEPVAVRLLCADTHPDHDTICTFRRVHRELLARSFAQVLELSAQCGRAQGWRHHRGHRRHQSAGQCQ